MQRISAMLARRGFGWDITRQTIRMVLDEKGMEEPEED